MAILFVCDILPPGILTRHSLILLLLLTCFTVNLSTKGVCVIHTYNIYSLNIRKIVSTLIYFLFATSPAKWWHIHTYNYIHLHTHIHIVRFIHPSEYDTRFSYSTLQLLQISGTVITWLCVYTFCIICLGLHHVH